MSQELVLHLSPDLLQVMSQQATVRQQDVAELAEEILAQAFLPTAAESEDVYDADEQAMLREQAAYERLHPELRELYPQQFVAIWQGEVVDRDRDIVTLHGRVRSNYPEQIVLIRQIEASPDPILHVRSPRFLRT